MKTLLTLTVIKHRLMLRVMSRDLEGKFRCIKSLGTITDLRQLTKTSKRFACPIVLGVHDGDTIEIVMTKQLLGNHAPQITNPTIEEYYNRNYIEGDNGYDDEQLQNKLLRQNP
jgi:hypothetical protein